MPTYTKRDGTVLAWTGTNTCLCTKCEVLFNSVAAFDAHLRRKKGRGRGKAQEGAAEHDYEWMPVNAKGYRVIALLSERQKEDLWNK